MASSCCGPDCGADCGSGVDRSAVLPEGDAVGLDGALKALADPVRLRLLSLLAAAPNGEVCACDLVKPLGRSQPTVSHHLKALREANLVTAERRGTWIWYAVDRHRVQHVMAALAAVTGMPLPALPA